MLLVHPKRVEDIVVACVVLHNMMRDEKGAGGAGAERGLEDEEIPCGLQDGDQLVVMAGTTNSAKEQRDYLKNWFNGADAVPW